jgi:hypothetical protein
VGSPIQPSSSVFIFNENESIDSVLASAPDPKAASVSVCQHEQKESHQHWLIALLLLGGSMDPKVIIQYWV